MKGNSRQAELRNDTKEASLENTETSQSEGNIVWIQEAMEKLEHSHFEKQFWQLPEKLNIVSI